MTALSAAAALFGLLAPVAAAWLALLALRLRSDRDSRLGTAAVALGAGLGLSSITTFWCASGSVVVPNTSRNRR